jgi:hypothetical protein
MFSFKNWVNAPEIGYPLVKNEATLDKVMHELHEKAKACLEKRKTKDKAVSSRLDDVKNMVVLAALMKVLKLKNFTKSSKHQNSKVESRNKKFKRVTKTDLRTDQELSAKISSAKSGKMNKYGEKAFSESRRPKPSVLTGDSLIRDKLRKYGYYHEPEFEDKEYEIVKFRWIESSEIIPKSDTTTGMYSKFSKIGHIDNPTS